MHYNPIHTCYTNINYSSLCLRQKSSLLYARTSHSTLVKLYIEHSINNGHSFSNKKIYQVSSNSWYYITQQHLLCNEENVSYYIMRLFFKVVHVLFYSNISTLTVLDFDCEEYPPTTTS